MFGEANTAAIGTQLAQTWAAGAIDERPLGDFSGEDSKVSMSRVTVHGRVFVRLQWGTGAQHQLIVRAPLTFDIKGKYNVQATPIDAGGATAKLSAVNVYGAGPELVRQLLVFVAVAIPIDPAAAYFHSLTAATLTVAGVAVAVAASGVRIPLVPDSVLTAGAGVAEFVL